MTLVLKKNLPDLCRQSEYSAQHNTALLGIIADILLAFDSGNLVCPFYTCQQRFTLWTTRLLQWLQTSVTPWRRRGEVVHFLHN